MELSHGEMCRRHCLNVQVDMLAVITINIQRKGRRALNMQSRGSYYSYFPLFKKGSGFSIDLNLQNITTSEQKNLDVSL